VALASWGNAYDSTRTCWAPTAVVERLHGSRRSGRPDTNANVRWWLAMIPAGTLLLFPLRANAVQGDTSGPALSPAAIGLPLTPTRVVRLRVTEGTWISLDVSPDGRTIVLDLLGDLYVLPSEGGRATRITSGMAITRQPRYSPDGRHLAFVTDRGGSENVWVSDVHGRNARQLSHLRGYDGYGAVTSPTWSPDGRTIVVSQRLGATGSRGTDPAESRRWMLAAYDVATGRMRWISDTAPDRVRSALGPAFGPRQDVVYAAVDAASRPVPWRGLGNWRIVRVDLASRRIEPEMGANVGRVGMRPAVSRDGRYLVYATSSGSHVGLRLRDLSTDRERWLVREVLDDPPFEAAESRDLVPGYAFTPDSKAIIAAYGGKIRRIELATGHTLVLPFVAEVERGLGSLTVHQLALADTAVRTRGLMQPALSPDGSLVTFSALDRIWVMELPRGGQAPGRPYRLTIDSGIGEFYPSWSPDGTWIAYSTWRDGEGGAVRRAYVRRTAAARQRPSERLTSDTAMYFHTAVQRDGERVIAVRASLSADRQLRSPLDPAPLDLILVRLRVTGGLPQVITSLTGLQSGFRFPVDQVYLTSDPTLIRVGLQSVRSRPPGLRTKLTVLGGEPSGELANEPYDVAGVISPNAQRAFIVRKCALFELFLPAPMEDGSDTLDLERARTQPFGAAGGAARRWGTALAPWFTWSADGRRVLFNQGGTLFMGDARPDGWTAFTQIDVPLPVHVDIPRGIVALRGARLITMHGHKVIERGDLVVRDNRIAAVGAYGQVPIPRGARILDLAGKTILPGYVDIHDHLGLAKGVHPQQSWQGLVRLAYGVTTARDPEPGPDNDVFTYQERERSGDLLSPRLFSTGGAYYGADPPIRTLDDARDRVRPNAQYFNSETFKVYYDHSTDRRARQLLAKAVAEQGLNATVHTGGLELAMAGVLDGFSGIEHPSRVRIYDDVATLIARSGTTHTGTYGALIFGSLNYMVRRRGWPWEWATMRRFVPRSAWQVTCIGCSAEEVPAYSPIELDNLIPLVSSAARTAAKGGRVAIGAHGNIPGLGFHYEMWLHRLGGMANHEILRAATITGAEAIGHAKDLGSLEPGKLADLQVLNDNPLKDVHHTATICYVMKNGRLYDARTLAEIWPRNRTLPTLYPTAPISPADSGRVSRQDPRGQHDKCQRR
jgi:imidazolonepropionase-like amidohydrolase/Tol biopolymer transport system component